MDAHLKKSFAVTKCYECIKKDLFQINWLLATNFPGKVYAQNFKKLSPKMSDFVEFWKSTNKYYLFCNSKLKYKGGRVSISNFEYKN